jgi:hypothetical protein
LFSHGQCRYALRLKWFKGFILQNQTAEAAGSVGSGIDIDPVWSDVDFVHGGVAMHDDFAELFFMEKKVVADPKHVFFALLPERDARSYSRMDKEKFAATKR